MCVWSGAGGGAFFGGFDNLQKAGQPPCPVANELSRVQCSAYLPDLVSELLASSWPLPHLYPMHILVFVNVQHDMQTSAPGPELLLRCVSFGLCGTF